MNIEGVNETNCCGLDELHGFYHSKDKGSWMGALRAAHLDSNDSTELAAICVFTMAEYQKGSGTPSAFARWLVKQGETVVRTRRVKNKNSGNKIQAFLWAPSANFRAKFRKYNDKQDEKEEKQENDSTVSPGWSSW